MSAKHAECKTDIAELARNIARRDAAVAKRGIGLIVTIVGLLMAAAAILGFPIRLPAAG